MGTLIDVNQDEPNGGSPGPEWWHPEESAVLGRIEQETIRSFGQVLLAAGYTPEDGRIAIKEHTLLFLQRAREQQQVANTTGEALSSDPELEALRSFETQLVSHGHTPEQVRQITAPFAALTSDRSIDVAKAEEAAMQSIRAFTAMHVAVPAPASEPVEDEYLVAQRAKSVVEADAERLCEKAQSLHVKWKESEAKVKEAQARVVEEERLQQIQRKRNKKTRQRARKTMDTISAQRDAEAKAYALARSFLEEVKSERDAESAAAKKLQARWRGRTFRRHVPQQGVCVGIDGNHRPATFFQGRAVPKSSLTIAAERAAEQRQRARDEAARAKRAKKERRRARAASEADAAEALRVECEARRAARQRQAAHERDQESATFIAEQVESESEYAPHEEEDCAGDLEFANQMAQALQLSAEEACLREKFNTYDAVAGELAFDPAEDHAPPLEEERSAAECVVCWNEATYIVIPCGHFCLCTNCVPKGLDKCPICRGAITQVVKVFVS